MMDEPRRRSRTPYAIAGIVAVALIVAARSTTPGEPSAAIRRNCTSITVVSSSEKADLLGEIAQTYAQANHQVDGACADVTVAAKSSGEAADALVTGWDETTDGPRPDVWTPVTSSWLEIVTERLAAADAPQLIPEEVGHVAAGPLVIAMPCPMAEAMGWPRRQIGWTDLFALAQDPAGWGRFGHPEWGPFKLGKTNPNFSTSGLNSLIGEYYAATGSSSDLTLASIRDPEVRRFVRGVESSVVHYGDISITFLENLRRADDQGQGLTYVSAVAIEEKSVWDYNQGNPSGDPASLGVQSPPSTPLVAVYPKEGTLVNDHPFAILDAPWVSPTQRDVAEDFLRFVQAPAQQSRFQALGFRDYRGRPGDQIDLGNGLLPDQPKLVLSTPSAPVLDAIQRSWDDVRKRARVLLVLDISGSMGDPVDSAGATKLELAKRAALAALEQFAPDDEVGIWIFSQDLGPHGQPWKELSPVSPLGPKLDDIRGAIGKLRPTGGTGLYATTSRAAGAMTTSFDPSRINGVVVLTDGRNEDPSFGFVDPLLTQLEHEPADRAVRVFCIAYGDDADVAVLERISDASMGATYEASDPTSIEEVFADVISNF